MWNGIVSMFFAFCFYNFFIRRIFQSLFAFFVIGSIFVFSTDIFLVFKDVLYCEFYEKHVAFYRFGKLIKILYYKDIYYMVGPGPFDNEKYLYL